MDILSKLKSWLFDVNLAFSVELSPCWLERWTVIGQSEVEEGGSSYNRAGFVLRPQAAADSPGRKTTFWNPECGS